MVRRRARGPWARERCARSRSRGFCCVRTESSADQSSTIARTSTIIFISPTALTRTPVNTHLAGIFISACLKENRSSLFVACLIQVQRSPIDLQYTCVFITIACVLCYYLQQHNNILTSARTHTYRHPKKGCAIGVVLPITIVLAVKERRRISGPSVVSVQFQESVNSQSREIKTHTQTHKMKNVLIGLVVANLAVLVLSASILGEFKI